MKFSFQVYPFIFEPHRQTGICNGLTDKEYGINIYKDNLIEKFFGAG